MEERNHQNIYDENKKAIKRKYPSILENFNKGNEEIDIQIINARDNNKTMLIKKNDKKFYINSKYKPLDEARKWVNGLLPVKKNALIIVFGFGLGYRISELLNVIEDTNKLLIIEPCTKILKNTMKNVDISQIINDDRVVLFTEKEEKQYQKIISESIHWKNAHIIVNGQIPNYSQIFKKEYKEFEKAFLRSHVIGLSNYLTMNVSGVQWQKNLFLNAKYSINGMDIDVLSNKFIDKPAIIVSAGPSLNKNVKLLKEIKDKAVIISVDTALKVLLSHKIYPDFVVTIDGSEENFRKFKEIEYSNIPLVFFPVVYPAILEKHKGHKFVFTSEKYKMNISNTFEEHMKKAGQLIASGSVAVSSISLAHKIGANPIVLIGQDLAFTDNFTHAIGSANFKANACEQSSTPIPVEDVYGNTVNTSSALYAFLQDIQKIIEVDDSGRIYIDATEGGAKIKGTKIMTLKETISKYMRHDIQVKDKISNIIDKNRITSLHTNKIEKIKYELVDLKKELELIEEKCDKGYSKLTEMVSIYKENKQFENYEKIKKIVVDIEDIQAYLKENEDVIDNISYAIELLLIKASNEIGEFDIEKINEFENRDLSAIRSNISFYKGIKDIIHEVLPSIEEAINKF